MGVLTASNEKTKLLQDQKKSESAEVKHKYPKSVFFIIGNEFCERFTYYGLRTILILYLTQRLMYSNDTGTIIYHLFTMLAYFSPLLGAIIADSWLGKFRTILYLSILYAIGCIILSVGSFPNELDTMKLMSLIGLLIIALGTGGIKPCVSAFGGDQFKEGQETQLKQFFSLFYLAINLGSVVSTFITPMFRADIQCMGEKTCFALAFGVPASLMIVAILFFVCGKPLYKIKPPEGNIILKVTKCICHAIGKKFKGSDKKKAHWLDYADDKFDKSLIADIKILFHVLVLYIPLPIFWALFDQQGSRWTLQATNMDGTVGSWYLKADQVQVINPLLIVFFIPLFEYIIYPLLAKCNLLTKPLQRITAGGILAALSFVVAGLLELQLETAYPVLPSAGHSEVTIINNSPCFINLEGIQNANVESIKAFENTIFDELPMDQSYSWKFVPTNCSTNKPYEFNFNPSSSMLSLMITLQNNNLEVLQSNETKKKATTGEPKVKLFYNSDPHESANTSFKLVSENKEYYIESGESYGITEYAAFPPGSYKIYAPYNKTTYYETPVAEEIFKSGGVYIVSIYNKTNEDRKSSTFEMVLGNSLHIILQAPQYIIITAGEIMFSITGLEFSYSQSPTSMKSVVQAAWLLTVAFGNLIVMIIAELRVFEQQSHELFFFGILMVVDMIIFAILAYFYKYVTIKKSDGEGEADPMPSKGRNNDGYVEETDFNK